MNQTIDAQRALHHQLILLEIVERLSVNATLAEGLAVLPDLVRQAVQADGVCLVIDSGRDRLYSAGADDVAEKAFHQNKAMLLAAVAQGEWLDTAVEGAWATLGSLGLARLVAVPIRDERKSNGLLVIGYTSAYTLDEVDKIFLKIVARQLSTGLRSAQIRDRLMAILNHSTDPIIVIDQAGLIALANPAAEQALKLPVDASVIGQRVEDVIHSEPLLALLQSTSNEKPDKPSEWQSETGQTFIVLVASLAGNTPTSSGRVLIMRDVTRFKQLHANHTDFVDTILHDLRSPLTYMQGYANMLPMVGELTAKQRDFADKITTGITQMTDLVEKSLDAGRLDPETGYYQLNREFCDLAKVASDVVATHQQSAEKKGLKLDAQIDPNLPLLNLDVMLVKRALNNLVDNAVKYTPGGGTITVSAFTKDETVVLSVHDTGLGISPENQRHLFERFRRVHRTEHQRVKGSGLGLFVVKNVAQRHSGDAWVESVEQVGSTFSMSIPIAGANLPGIAGKSTSG